MSNTDRSAAEYALEKLGDAVQLLATHESRVTIRVARAGESLLLIAPKALPSQLRSRFEKLMKRLGKHPGWRVAFNLRGVRGATGSKLALEIYSLESELRSYLDHQT